MKALSDNDTVLARRKYLETTQNEQEVVDYIKQEYRKVVANKRLNLKPMF